MRCAIRILAALVLVPVTVQGQGDAGRSSDPSLLFFNAAAGGLTGAIGRLAAGRRVLPGIVRGSVGGAVVFGGKRLVAEQSPLASWTGRQIAALGSSEVRNAISGASILSEAVVPLGPVRLYVRRSPGFRVRPKLDLSAVVAIVVASRSGDNSFDWSESLAHGAIIYEKPLGFGSEQGTQVAGVIEVREQQSNVIFNPDNLTKAGITAHELIHALQYDFASIALGEPIERAIMRDRIPMALHRYVDIGVGLFFIQTVGLFSNALEDEAQALAPGS